jgi:hypothetical protein
MHSHLSFSVQVVETLSSATRWTLGCPGLTPRNPGLVVALHALNKPKYLEDLSVYVCTHVHVCVCSLGAGRGELQQGFQLRAQPRMLFFLLQETLMSITLLGTL